MVEALENKWFMTWMRKQWISEKKITKKNSLFINNKKEKVIYKIDRSLKTDVYFLFI